MLQNLLVTSIIFINFTLTTVAQTYDPEEYNTRKDMFLKYSGMRPEFSKKISSFSKKIISGEAEEGFKGLYELKKGKLTLSEFASINDTLGMMYLFGKLYDNAISTFEQTLSLQGIGGYTDNNNSFMLSISYYLKEDYLNAVKYLNRHLIYQDVPEPIIYKFLAVCYFHLGDKEAVKYAFEQIDKLSENKNYSQNIQLPYKINLNSYGIKLEGLNYPDLQKNGLEEKVNTITNKPYWLLHDTRKNYPIRALRKKLDGTVKLKFDLDNHGKAQNIELISSTNEYFEKDAQKSLSKFKFILYRPSDDQFYKKGITIDLKYDHENYLKWKEERIKPFPTQYTLY